MGSERGKRAMGRRGSAPGWDEERRLQKQRDRRRSFPWCGCVCKAGCMPVALLAHTCVRVQAAGSVHHPAVGLHVGQVSTHWCLGHWEPLPGRLQQQQQQPSRRCCL